LLCKPVAAHGCDVSLIGAKDGRRGRDEEREEEMHMCERKERRPERVNSGECDFGAVLYFKRTLKFDAKA